MVLLPKLKIFNFLQAKLMVVTPDLASLIQVFLPMATPDLASLILVLLPAATIKVKFRQRDTCRQQTPGNWLLSSE